MLNKATLIGNLGADPDIRYTQSGQPVTNFRMATSDRWTDQNGETQERTEWHRIVVWGRLAEICGRYLAKGRRVYVEGCIQTRQYEKDGETRYITEIKAATVLFLDGQAGEKRDPQPQEPPPARDPQPRPQKPSFRGRR